MLPRTQSYQNAPSGETNAGIFEDITTRSLSSVTIGQNAGKRMSGAARNVCAGYESARDGLRMTDTVALGYRAGAMAQNVISSVYIGSYAGASATGGNESVFAGFRSGEFNRDGTGLVGIGPYTLRENVAGSYSVATGYRAMERCLDGDFNAAHGAFSLQDLRSASFVTSMGFMSGRGASRASESCYFGAYAGYSNTDGIGNSLFGYRAGEFVTGSFNCAIGYGALQYASGASCNIAIGPNAGANLDNGSNTVVVGMNAGGNGGSRCVILGISAGSRATSNTNDSVLIGYQTGIGANSSNIVLIGSRAGSVGLNAPGAVLIGYRAGKNLAVGRGNILIGPSADTYSPINYNGIAIGTSNVFTSDFGVAIGTDIYNRRAYSVLLGYDIRTDANYSVLMGNHINLESVLFFKDPLADGYQSTVLFDGATKYGISNIVYPPTLYNTANMGISISNIFNSETGRISKPAQDYNNYDLRSAILAGGSSYIISNGYNILLTSNAAIAEFELISFSNIIQANTDYANTAAAPSNFAPASEYLSNLINNGISNINIPIAQNNIIYNFLEEKVPVFPIKILQRLQLPYIDSPGIIYHEATMPPIHLGPSTDVRPPAALSNLRYYVIEPPSKGVLDNTAYIPGNNINYRRHFYESASVSDTAILRPVLEIGQEYQLPTPVTSNDLIYYAFSNVSTTSNIAVASLISGPGLVTLTKQHLVANYASPNAALYINNIDPNVILTFQGIAHTSNTIAASIAYPDSRIQEEFLIDSDYLYLAINLNQSYYDAVLAPYINSAIDIATSLEDYTASNLAKDILNATWTDIQNQYQSYLNYILTTSNSNELIMPEYETSNFTYGLWQYQNYILSARNYVSAVEPIRSNIEAYYYAAEIVKQSAPSPSLLALDAIQYTEEYYTHASNLRYLYTQMPRLEGLTYSNLTAGDLKMNINGYIGQLEPFKGALETCEFEIPMINYNAYGVATDTYIVKPPIYGHLTSDLIYDAYYPWAFSNLDTAVIMQTSNITLEIPSPYHGPFFATDYTVIIKPANIALESISDRTLNSVNYMPISISNISTSNIYLNDNQVYSDTIYQDLAGIYSSNSGYHTITSNVYVNNYLEVIPLLTPDGSNTSYLIYSTSNLLIDSDGSVSYTEYGPTTEIISGPEYNIDNPYYSNNLYKIHTIKTSQSNYLAENTIINRITSREDHISVYDSWGGDYLFSSNQSVTINPPIVLSSNNIIAPGPYVYTETSNLIDNSNLRLDVPAWPLNKWYYSTGISTSTSAIYTGSFIKKNIGYTSTVYASNIDSKEVWLANPSITSSINNTVLGLHIIESATVAQVTQNVQTINLDQGFRLPMSTILNNPPVNADTFQILDHDISACVSPSSNLLIQGDITDIESLSYIATENAAIDRVKFMWLSNNIPVGPIFQTTLFINRDPNVAMDINISPSAFSETNLKDFYGARGSQGLRVRFFPSANLAIGGPGAGAVPIAMSNVLQTTITPLGTETGTYNLTYQFVPENDLTPVIAESTLPVRVYSRIQWPGIDTIGAPSVIEYDYYGNDTNFTDKYIGSIWDSINSLKILDTPMAASDFNVIITDSFKNGYISSNADDQVSIFNFPFKTGNQIAYIPYTGAHGADILSVTSNESIKIRLEYQSNISPEYSIKVAPYYAPFPSVAQTEGYYQVPAISAALLSDGYRWYPNVGLSNTNGNLLVDAAAWSQSNYFGKYRAELGQGLACNLEVDQADRVDIPLPLIGASANASNYHIVRAPLYGVIDLASRIYQNDGVFGTSNDSFVLGYSQSPYDLSIGSIEYNIIVNPLPIVIENYELFNNLSVPLNSNIVIDASGTIKETHTMGLSTGGEFMAFTYSNYKAGTIKTYGSDGGTFISTLQNPLRNNYLYSNLFLTEITNYYNEYWSINSNTSPSGGSNATIGYFIDGASAASLNMVEKNITISFNVRPSQPIENRLETRFLQTLKFELKIGTFFHAIFHTERVVIRVISGAYTTYAIPSFVFGQFTNVKFINNNTNGKVSLYIGATDVLEMAEIPGIPFTVAPSDIQILVNTRDPENYFGTSNFTVGSNSYNLVEFRTLIEYQELEITATTYNIQDTGSDEQTHNIVLGKNITVRGIDNICLGNSFSTSGKNSIIIGNDIGDLNSGQVNDVYESIVIGNTSFQNSVVRDVIAIGRNLLNNLSGISAAPVINFFSKSPIIIGNSIDATKLDYHVNVANTFAKTSVDGDQIYLGLSGEKVRVGYTSNVGASTGATFVTNGSISSTQSYGFTASVPLATAGMVVTLSGTVATDPLDPLIYGVMDDSLNNVVALGRAPCLLDSASAAVGSKLYVSATTPGYLSISNIPGAVTVGVYLGNNTMFVRCSI